MRSLQRRDMLIFVWQIYNKPTVQAIVYFQCGHLQNAAYYIFHLSLVFLFFARDQISIVLFFPKLMNSSNFPIFPECFIECEKKKTPNKLKILHRKMSISQSPSANSTVRLL